MDKLYRNIGNSALLKSIYKELSKTIEDFPDLSDYKKIYQWDLQQRGRRYMGPILDYGNWYLPISDPFVDKDLINFAIGLPFELLMKKNFLKEILKRKFPEVSKIKLSHSSLSFNKYLPF